MPHETTPIADYAVLGDGHTVALVSRHGSIDWLCLPGFDSAACFAALLGTPDNGRWLVTVEDAEISRRYQGDSFNLETTYTTPEGTAVVVDSMPMADGRADLVRNVTAVSGTVRVRHEWVVRFGYGLIEPFVRRVQDPHGNEALRAIAGPDAVLLRSSRPELPTAVDHRHAGTFELNAGESIQLGLTWTHSWEPVPARLPVRERIEASRIRWEQWAAKADYQGRYREQVVRSLMVLRLLTDARTGGIVAAPTTSLPELFGGVRNWDYRFCWLRDAALTLEALLEHGYTFEVADWRDWLLRAVAGDPADVQIMYRVDGGRDLPERELDLPGYLGSRPVRVGNAAVTQVQHDVLGEVMSALDLARASGLPETEESWALQRMLTDHLADHWQEPDFGIWEVRGPARHFTHSKIMAWAALDRAVQGVERYGLPGPVDRWRTVREAIRTDVLARGYNQELGTFTQSYGSRNTDAALLQLVQVGFLEPDDERFLGTLARVRSELEVTEGLLHRYQPESSDDGLAGGEHAFLACSFWLADALARCDRLEEATRVLDRLVGLGNDLHLFSEEYDPEGDLMAGNFPQALSHLALVRAVHSHDLALRRARRRSGAG